MVVSRRELLRGTAVGVGAIALGNRSSLLAGQPAFAERSISELVEEVWRVDVAAETVRVSRRAARAELLHETEVSWSPARVGRSCRVPIAPLFEGL